MFGVGMIELALVVVVLLLVVMGCFALAARSRSSEITPTKEWRRVRQLRLLGIALGLLIAGLLMDHDAFGPLGDVVALLVPGYGVGTMIAPAGFGLGVLLGVAAGETIARAPRPSGPRTASLQPRSLTGYLPRGSSYAVGTGVALLAATLLLGTLTAQEDGSLGGMRAIGCQTEAFTQARGPYPGSYYAVPLAIMLGIVLLTALAAAAAVVRRPRGLAATDAGDDELRRRSMTVILAAVGVAVGASLTGIAGTAATGLLGLSEDCAPAWMPVVGWLLVPLVFLGFGLAAWSLARLFVNDSLTGADGTGGPSDRSVRERA
ncbi:hypothetical protein [Nocardioides panzhihuensis]|uniref:Uncharacterized protein n=1 Tax=Nocardioides panzhihuensis TaxID=860243 RepID=A0A7Z0DJN7_9ACTN|nr:hypothetical protein [Nocardioides panzhihuensis]NYI76620.1 hypothetical protein [Nocardioides panzhihuensis]